MQETVLHLFTFPVFVIFRTVLPWIQWAALEWAGIALAAAVLLLRRVPMMGMFGTLVPALEGRRDAVFAGWFGPIGIAAIFDAMVAHRILGDELIWTAASLVIASSVLAHGVTATPGTKLYGRLTGAEESADRTGVDGSPLADE